MTLKFFPYYPIGFLYKKVQLGFQKTIISSKYQIILRHITYVGGYVAESAFI